MADSVPKPFKKYSWVEVEAQKSKGYTFLVIKQKVYDVTKFVEDHPGGEEELTTRAGFDSTEAFEDVGHSTDARNLMKEYLVGEIAEGELAVKQATQTFVEKAGKINTNGKIAEETKRDVRRDWEVKPAKKQLDAWLLPAGMALLAILAYGMFLASYSR